MPDMDKLEEILIKKKDVTFGRDHLSKIIKNVSESTSIGLLNESETSILSIMRLLNTLSYLNEDDMRIMITDAWMYYIITLSDKIATENAHVWIEIFNRLHNMYKESYGFIDESGSVIDTITLSCHLKKCSPSEIQKSKYSKNLVKRLNDFHDHTTKANIKDHTSEKFLEAYYQKFPDRAESGLWNVFIPKIIREFLVQIKRYTFKDDFFEKINHLLRGNKKFNGRNIITDSTLPTYISVLATLLFPATLSKDMIVYRKDTIMDKPNCFSTDAFFSTSFSYESVQPFNIGKQNRIIRITIPQGTKFLPTIGIDRKEREITLMPGTTLTRESGACSRKEYNRGYQHMFCDYKVTGTKDLSDESQKQLFLYMVRSYWQSYNEYDSPYNDKVLKNILNGIIEDIRSEI